MHETALTFDSDPGITIAGTLCLPSGDHADPVPAIVLLGGTFGDTRDGDMAPERTPYASTTPRTGLLRHIAHALEAQGIATLRFDKRGCGESSGSVHAADEQSDLRDAIAAVRALRSRPGIDAARIGLCGHSAGASQACAIAKQQGDIACVGLLGMLFSSFEDLVRWNWGRVAAMWSQLNEEQRQWLRNNRQRDVVAAFRTEEFLAAARAGANRVVLSAEGLSVEFDLVRFRHGMDGSESSPRLTQYRGVRCPALVLHGGVDMNVRVEDALESYRALREVGNSAVTLLILPGLDHNFQPAPPDPFERAWERVTFASHRHPISSLALDAIASWAGHVLRSGGRASPDAARAVVFR